MLLHMVMIKWKDGTTKSQIDAMNVELRDLAKIESVTNLAIGPILKDSNKDYDIVVSMMLPSKEFLDKTYMSHPIHQRVGGSLVKIMGGMIGCDAEV